MIFTYEAAAFEMLIFGKYLYWNEIRVPQS